MRRRKAGPDGVPTHLRTFSSDRWGKDPQSAFRAWIDARKAYWAEHPMAWPDFVSMMAGPANVRAKALGRRVPYPGEDEG